jgi:glycosyltransferase involved in cell wall biosynthesis
MRIGLLIYGRLDTLTGGYLYDRLVVREWRRRGAEVLVYSLPWRSYTRHLLDNFSPALFQTLKQARLDVLVQDELNHPSLFWLNRLLRPHIDYPLLALVHLLRFSERHPPWQTQLYRLVERSYFRSLDGAIYNSHDSRQLAESLVGKDLPGLVAYPGKDHLPGVATPAGAINSRDQSLRFVSVGNVVPRKGLHTLLAALARLPQRNWRLQVVGSLEMDPAYVASIRRQIAAAGLVDHIDLVGQIPNERVGGYLARADLFLLVSQYEGFGIVYLEALRHGIPVVASTGGAAGEIVRHNQEGWLVPPEDPVALGRILNDVIIRPEQLTAMRAAALARYNDFPTWAESAAAIHDFLAGIVQAYRNNVSSPVSF